MLDIQKLRDLAESVIPLLDELESLRSERTAWRVTAENAEKQLEDLKASIGSPKHIGLEQAQEEGLLDAPYQPEA